MGVVVTVEAEVASNSNSRSDGIIKRTDSRLEAARVVASAEEEEGRVVLVPVVVVVVGVVVVVEFNKAVV